MLLNLMVLGFTFLINLVLAVLVFLKNKKNLINQSFALFVLTIAGWSGAIALALITGNIFWANISFIFGALIPGTLLPFALVFKRRPYWRKQYFWVLLPTAFFIFSIYFKPNLLFSGFQVLGGGLSPDERGPLYPLFVLYVLGYAVASISVLVRKLKRASGIYRYQLRYLLLGILSFATLASITNVVLPFFGVNQFNSLGPLFSIIMVGLISYSILRYRFLEIRIVVETTLAYLLAITLTVLIALAAHQLIIKWAYLSELIVNLVVLLFALILFPTLKKFIGSIVETVNRPTFDSQNSIKTLAAGLTRLVDLEEIVRAINETITNSLGLKASAIALFEANEITVYSTRPYPENLKSILKHGPVVRFLSDFKSPLICQEVELLADPQRKENFLTKVCAIIKDLPIEVYLPLIHQNKLIGVITLEKKLTGEAFSKRELEMLETLAHQAAIAIANGRLYKEIKDLNLDLRQKVKEQTKHLDRLLRIKEEFLKITSHQLRTPTTIVKGMLSMILEGSLDEDEVKKRQYLEQSYRSVKNLERVIHSILDASDLAAGKLMMDFEPIDLGRVVEKLTDERSHLAKERKLNLRLEKTANPLPAVMADKLKIREAIANLVDNAIRYTKEGEVCVSLSSTADQRWVCVSVRDTGVGIKPEDKSKIFKKFARADGSALINPDGSGLGLYIVKEIVSAHRGHIEVESKGENKGSTFKITLPARN